MKKSPNQTPFSRLEVPRSGWGRQFPGRYGRLPVDRSLADLRADHFLGYPGLVGDTIRELIAGGGVWNSGGYRQHFVEELTPVFVMLEVQAPGCLVEQVL
jgi:hypothetical protein